MSEVCIQFFKYIKIWIFFVLQCSAQIYNSANTTLVNIVEVTQYMNVCVFSDGYRKLKK